MKNEVWKDIEGYEGYYQVSNYGRIKSIPRTVKTGTSNKAMKKVGGHILKPTIRRGYLIVGLYKNSNRKTCSVHRLVAQAFINNPNKYPIINHIDEDKTNNKVSNLEWCTQLYNINYGGAISKSANSQKKEVYKCDMDGNIIKKYNSMLDTEKDGFTRTLVSACCRGVRNKHKGYKWRYVNE